MWALSFLGLVKSPLAILGAPTFASFGSAAFLLPVPVPAFRLAGITDSGSVVDATLPSGSADAIALLVTTSNAVIGLSSGAVELPSAAGVEVGCLASATVADC